MKTKGQIKIQARKNQRFLVPKSSKGQIKIQEMAFMLVGVIFFFGLVAIFMLSLLQTSLYGDINRLAREKNLVAVSALAEGPEFSCSKSRANCVDEDKVVALTNNSNYDNFWKFSSLSILRISGFNKTPGERVICSRENYPNCDIHIIYTKEDKNIKKEDVVGSYVALCRKELIDSYTYERCELSQFLVGTEIKEAKNG
jgi:hypothetical protein